MSETLIHPHAIVETNEIGEGTRIWAFVHILNGAKIGNNCNICDHCYIEHNVVIGSNVTIKCGIYLWEGVHIEDDVFLGPNVVFTNNPRPRSKQYIEHLKTFVKKGASIGANTTILAGTTIGKYAMIGIGSVVTKNIPDYALAYGNPAVVKGWVDEEGNNLQLEKEGLWKSIEGKYYKESSFGLMPIMNNL